MTRLHGNAAIRHMILTALLLFFGQAGYAENRADLRIGYVPILTQLPIVVSYDNDRLLFKKRGLKLIKYTSFTSIEAAMRAGAIDVAAIPVPIALSMATDGEDIRIIGTCHQGGALIVARQKGSLDSLRGQLIGVPGLDSNEAFLLNQVLGRRGLRSGLDYKTIAIPFRIALDHLKTDRLDAIFLPEPFGTMAEQEGVAFAVKGQEKLSKSFSSVLTARPGILDEKEALVTLWLDSIVKSCRFIEADVREAGAQQSAIIQKAYFQFPKQIVTRSLVGHKGNLRFNLFIPDLDGIRAYLDLSIQLKMITRSIPLENIVSLELMKQAVH